MISPVVYLVLAIAVLVSFWASLVEATYLTLRPVSLSSSIKSGSVKATQALGIVNEKTRLVSVTTFLDTISNVVLATTIGLVLSDLFGPIGWLYSAIGASFAIMILLYLLPKAIGIENALRMSLYLAPSTGVLLSVLAPVALPLTRLARALSQRLVGKSSYKEMDLAAEFEDVVSMLEKAGNVEPDAGRLLRTALASSRSRALDVMTPIIEIVAVNTNSTVFDALRAMGQTNHPRMPVYDPEKDDYVAAVTFRTLSRAMSKELLDSSIKDYLVEPARVSTEDGLATVIEKMQDARTTIAFVFDDQKMIGMITLSDILEQVLGVKV